MIDELVGDLVEVLRPIVSSLGVGNAAWVRTFGPAGEKQAADLSLPCFAFASEVRSPPAAISSLLAEQVCASIAGTSISESIDSVYSDSGFLNFNIDRGWLSKFLLKSYFEDVGGAPIHSRDSSEEGVDLLIEHTSANPNGPFHVGRARNAVLGDTLVRLNRLLGRQVRSEYYVDDMGKQVGILAWAMEHLSATDVADVLEGNGRDSGTPKKWVGKQDHERVLYYQAANILSEHDPSIGDAVGELVRKSEEGDEEVLRLFESAYSPVLDGMLDTLKRLRITYDSKTRESRFILDGSVDMIVEELSASPIHGVAANGAYYLELAERGIAGESTKFYYQRGDGSSLYATRDVAYHRWKWSQGRRLVNVLGEDHRLQSKQVAEALCEIGEKAPEVVFYAFIKLPDGKMSTRQGRVVYMDDLIEEAVELASGIVSKNRPDLSPEEKLRIAEDVGTSAVRFNIIRVAPEKGFTFQWSEALNFDGGSAPFIMYAHARCCAIERRVAKIQAELNDDASEKFISAAINGPESLRSLIFRLSLHDRILRISTDENRPQAYATWLLGLASDVNAVYRDCPVVTDGIVDAGYLLAIKISRHALARGCGGLGIAFPESM